MFDQPAGQKPYSYTAIAQADTSTALVDSYYDQNDSIASFTLDAASGQLVSSTGFLQVPAADFSGLCNDFSYATFENAIALTPCKRILPVDITSFSSACTGQLSLQRFVTSLFLAQ